MAGPFQQRLPPDPANAVGSTPRGEPITTVGAVASEPIAQGAIVHYWQAGSQVRVRNANATDATRPGRGYVKSAVAAGGQATIYPPGSVNDALSALKAGDYYLGQTPGSITRTPPTQMGAVKQFIGAATPQGTLAFAPLSPSVNTPPTPPTPGTPGPAGPAGAPGAAGGIGPAGPQGPAGTASDTDVIPTTVALVSGNLVHLGASGLVLADATDDTKPADGFVLASFFANTQAIVYRPGATIERLSGLTGGLLCYLSTAGALTQVVPTSGASQIIGRAIDATRVRFLPGTVGLV